jgi:hypothetical protein
VTNKVEQDGFLLSIEDVKTIIKFQKPVDHNAHWLPAGPVTYIELGVVVGSRLCTDEDRVFLGAPFMHQLAAETVTDPLRVIVFLGDKFVRRFRPLQHDVGPPAFNVRKEPFVEVMTFGIENTSMYLNSCRPEFPRTIASHQWVAVHVGDHHSFDLVMNQQVCAGRCLACVRTRLKVYKAGTLLKQVLVVDAVYRIHLGMRATKLHMPPFTDYSVFMHNDASYHWIGAHTPLTAQGKFYRPAHKNFIGPVIVFRHGSILAKL